MVAIVPGCNPFCGLTGKKPGEWQGGVPFGPPLPLSPSHPGESLRDALDLLSLRLLAVTYRHIRPWTRGKIGDN